MAIAYPSRRQPASAAEERPPRVLLGLKPVPGQKRVRRQGDLWCSRLSVSQTVSEPGSAKASDASSISRDAEGRRARAEQGGEARRGHRARTP